MIGQDIINYIEQNGLENAIVSVTATMYYQGDHECRTTTDVSISKDTAFDEEKKEYVPSVNFYVDDELY